MEDTVLSASKVHFPGDGGPVTDQRENLRVAIAAQESARDLPTELVAQPVQLRKKSKAASPWAYSADPLASAEQAAEMILQTEEQREAHGYLEDPLLKDTKEEAAEKRQQRIKEHAAFMAQQAEARHVAAQTQAAKDAALAARVAKDEAGLVTVAPDEETREVIQKPEPAEDASQTKVEDDELLSSKLAAMDSGASKTSSGQQLLLTVVVGFSTVFMRIW